MISRKRATNPGRISPRGAAAIWEQVAACSDDELEASRDGRADLFVIGERFGHLGEARSDRAVCWACGARIEAGAPVLVCFERVGAGFNQYNRRYLHVSRCIAGAP